MESGFLEMQGARRGVRVRRVALARCEDSWARRDRTTRGHDRLDEDRVFSEVHSRTDVARHEQQPPRGGGAPAHRSGRCSSLGDSAVSP